jgi:hypothetical protein
MVMPNPPLHHAEQVTANQNRLHAALVTLTQNLRPVVLVTTTSNLKLPRAVQAESKNLLFPVFEF